MAITTLDGALAGMQAPNILHKAITPTLVAQRPHSLFALAGIPSAASAFTPGVNGAALTSSDGQIPFPVIPGGSKGYLGRLQAQATQNGTLLLCDRLWHNSGLSVTDTNLQTLDSGALVARDRNGQSAGVDVFAAMEVTSALGAGTPTWTLTYTNTADAASRSTTNIFPVAASAAAGAFFPFGLQSGDLGIKKITGFQSSNTSTSGAFSLVLYRVLARMELLGSSSNALDALTSGFPEVFANTVPFLVFLPSTTTASYISGQVSWTIG